jgi:type I restriction enzyme R subunit
LTQIAHSLVSKLPAPKEEDLSKGMHERITEDIPNRVAADKAYQNATRNSDKQNARIEHDKAPARVMTAVLKDDTELFKQFMDNESFRRWLTDTVFGIAYDRPSA